MDPSADLAAALRPIRMPVPTETEALADGLLAFGLGLGAALIAYGLLRVILARREETTARLRAELAASRGLDPADRLLAQARLAAAAPATVSPAIAPAIAAVRATLAPALYLPDPTVDLDATDRALASAFGTRGR